MAEKRPKGSNSSSANVKKKKKLVPYISPFVLKARENANARVKALRGNENIPSNKPEWNIDARDNQALFDPELKKKEIFKILPKKTLNPHHTNVNSQDSVTSKSSITSNSAPKSTKRDFLNDNIKYVSNTGRVPARGVVVERRSVSPPPGFRRYETATKAWEGNIQAKADAHRTRLRGALERQASPQSMGSATERELQLLKQAEVMRERIVVFKPAIPAWKRLELEHSRAPVHLPAESSPVNSNRIPVEDAFPMSPNEPSGGDDVSPIKFATRGTNDRTSSTVRFADIDSPAHKGRDAPDAESAGGELRPSETAGPAMCTTRSTSPIDPRVIAELLGIEDYDNDDGDDYGDDEDDMHENDTWEGGGRNGSPRPRGRSGPRLGLDDGDDRADDPWTNQRGRGLFEMSTQTSPFRRSLSQQQLSSPASSKRSPMTPTKSPRNIPGSTHKPVEASAGGGASGVLSDVVRVLEAVGGIVKSASSGDARRRPRIPSFNLGAAREVETMQQQLLQQLKTHAESQRYYAPISDAALSLPPTVDSSLPLSVPLQLPVPSSQPATILAERVPVPQELTKANANAPTSRSAHTTANITPTSTGGTGKSGAAGKGNIPPSRAAVMDMILSKLQAVEKAEKDALELLAKTPSKPYGTSNLGVDGHGDGKGRQSPKARSGDDDVNARNVAAAGATTRPSIEPPAFAYVPTAVTLPEEFSARSLAFLSRDHSEGIEEVTVMRAPPVTRTNETTLPDFLDLRQSEDEPQKNVSKSSTTEKTEAVGLMDGQAVVELSRVGDGIGGRRDAQTNRAVVLCPLVTDHATSEVFANYKKELSDARRVREAVLRSRGTSLSELVNRLSDAIVEDLLQESAEEIEGVFDELAEKFVEDV